MDVRRNQAEKFAKEGHILRIELPLRGREMRFQDMARSKLQSFVDSVAQIYRIDGPIKFLGRRFISSASSFNSFIMKAKTHSGSQKRVKITGNW
jgi:translation initiation factor IF-3